MKRRRTRHTGHDTRGRRLLIEALRRRRLTQEKVAARLGIRQSNISGWCCGRRRPKPFFRGVLEAWLGIPRDAWLTWAERRRLLMQGSELGPE